jgi:hypothetical protein
MASSCSLPANRLLGSATRRRATSVRIGWDSNCGNDKNAVQPRRWRPLSATSPLFLSASDDAEKDASAETVESATEGEADLALNDDEEDDGVSSSGVTRTLLLAVPLFCKFVLVLMIKFVTDLIVYPLLLLYRGARITKRRVLRMFNGGSDASSSSSSSSGRKAVNGEKP